MRSIVRSAKGSACVAAQKQTARDDLVTMSYGLWRTEEDCLCQEVLEDLDRAETLTEVQAALSYWVSYVSGGAEDPDGEACVRLIPEFARVADERASAPVRWGRICWRPPLLPEELLTGDGIRLHRVP